MSRYKPWKIFCTTCLSLNPYWQISKPACSNAQHNSYRRKPKTLFCAARGQSSPIRSNRRVSAAIRPGCGENDEFEFATRDFDYRVEARRRLLDCRRSLSRSVSVLPRLPPARPAPVTAANIPASARSKRRVSQKQRTNQ